MKLSRSNPYIRVAIETHLIKGERQEVSFYDGDDYFTILCSGNSCYFYDSLNKLLEAKFVDQVT